MAASREQYFAVCKRRVPKQSKASLLDHRSTILEDSDESSENSAKDSEDEFSEAMIDFSDASSNELDDDISESDGTPISLGSKDTDLDSFSDTSSIENVTSESSDDDNLSLVSNSEDEVQESSDDDLQYPRISHPKRPFGCDVCGKPAYSTYFCDKCNGGDWDMCKPCFGKGNWCKSRQHLLAKCSPDAFSSGRACQERDISYTSLKLSQILLVFDAKQQPIRQVARFVGTDRDLLYDTPPVFHPTKPLIVWLRSQSQLLFADFAENSFFIKKIPLSSKCKST